MSQNVEARRSPPAKSGSRGVASAKINSARASKEPTLIGVLLVVGGSQKEPSCCAAFASERFPLRKASSFRILSRGRDAQVGGRKLRGNCL